ncbi:hypothetical protein [Paludibaculum fermentans]|uniref:hypothetical protein n=1 Tax=Paludibaculum fermentans TaxID=1473598 RepID=UPI003EBA88FB
MSTPPAPPHAELIDRPFSFYPPISGVENNEWRLREATWSEMMVRNTQEDLEIAIPRQYFGGISETDKPVMIVGLTQELEYKTGAVWPMKRKVYSMPVAPMTRPPGPKVAVDPSEPTGLGAIMGTGAMGNESRIGKMIMVTFFSVLTLGLMIWALVKFTPDTKPTYVAKDQGYLELNRDDDYFSIVRKLGQPSADRFKPDSGELQYRLLEYKDRGYSVVLMGTKQEDVRYIGAMGMGPDGKGWAPLHSIDYAKGANTMGILRTMPRF